MNAGEPSRVYQVMTRFAFVSTLLLAATFPASAVGQGLELLEPGDALVEVRLDDGSTLYGRVVDLEGDQVTLETPSGATARLDRARVVSVRLARGAVREGRVWPEARVGDRLFATPTGRTLEGGSGHAGFQELLFPYVAYGVVDRLQVTAGTTLVPEIAGQLWYVAPKAGIVSTPTAQLSAGAIAFFVFGDELDSEEWFGAAHASLTLGPAGRAVTVGTAFPFLHRGESDDLEFAEDPVVLVGGELRVSPSVTLVTDNAFVPGESGALLAGGVRLMGERLSADLGVSLLVDEGDPTCCVPVVNVQWAFGGD